jgi:hypothetical protein
MAALGMMGCTVTTPSFYVAQGISLDCVPASLAMVINNNRYLVGTSKLDASDIRYSMGNYKIMWSVQDALDTLDHFELDWRVVADDEFDGSGQAIVFTRVATGVGHAVYVNNNVVYDPLAIIGKLTYSYEELEIRDEIIVIN